MAIGQVINGKNRLVEHPNRYKLNTVSGQANTYDFEKQPGEITENGTPYAKTILDKIDNVLSYLTPSVEKVISQVVEKEDIITNRNILCSNVVTDNLDVNGVNNINGIYDYISTHLESPTFNIWTPSTDGFYMINSGLTNGRAIYHAYPTGSIGKKDDLKKALSQTSKNSSIYLELNTYNQYAYIDYDFKTQISGSITYNLYFLNTTCRILGSNDGINWINIGGTISNNSLKTITFNNYRYVRLETNGTVSNSYCEIFVFYINSINTTIPYTETYYQNQFTLDNNGTTFINNQRVLVEISKDEIADIIETGTTNLLPSSLTEISTTQYTGICLDSTGTSVEITTDDGYASNTRIPNIVDNDLSTLASSRYNNGFIKLNFNKPIKVNAIDIKGYCKDSNDNYGDLIISGSNDDSNYTELVRGKWTDSLTNVTFENNTKYKYYKITPFSSTYKHIVYEFNIVSWELVSGQEHSFDMEGVTSNTINNITCDTLLQPSTKYELIYNGDSNKFELGGARVLYDITLTEAVNQVDLTGISDVLKEYQLYLIEIIGSSSTSGKVSFGANDSTICTLYTTKSSRFALFLIQKENNLFSITILSQNSGNNLDASYGYFSLNRPITAEIIRMENANYNFNADTRIIIKEIS